MSKILVIGATGKTGRRVVERLQRRNIDVRPGSRNADIPFDWEKTATWPVALRGIEKVYITYQPDLAVPAALPAIRQFVQYAQQAQVKKLVLLSGRGEEEAQRCEDEVIRCGIDYTIVRASWFMQNFSENFLLHDILSGTVVLPHVKAREPFVDVDDIADVVVETLLNDIHSGKIYSLTGPELLSFRECVAMISEAANRNIQFQEISMEAYTEAMKQMNLPDDFIGLIRYLFTNVLDGRNEFTTNDVEQILNRRPRSFHDYAVLAAGMGVWDVK